MKIKNIILTGGTGVFGKFLINDSLKSNSRIILLIRADSQKQASERAKKLFKSNSISSDKIVTLRCDLTKNDLGLASSDYLNLKKTTTHILHAAASTRFTLPKVRNNSRGRI